MAELEGGHAALAVPSGLTATTLPLLALTKPGDHVLVTDAVYGPTRRFCDLHLQRLGVEVTYYDPLAGAARSNAQFEPNTKLVFAESPGSLTFEVQDVRAIADVAHARGALRRARQHVGDAALLSRVRPRRRRRRCTPRPSTSAATRTCCSASIVGERRRPIRRCSGCGPTWASRRRATTASSACAGLRTLAVRLAAAAGERDARSRNGCASGRRSKEVLYPGLPGARGHELWKRDFRGASSLFGVDPAAGRRSARRRDARRPRAVLAWA